MIQFHDILARIMPQRDQYLGPPISTFKSSTPVFLSIYQLVFPPHHPFRFHSLSLLFRIFNHPKWKNSVRLKSLEKNLDKANRNNWFNSQFQKPQKKHYTNNKLILYPMQIMACHYTDSQEHRRLCEHILNIKVRMRILIIYQRILVKLSTSLYTGSAAPYLSISKHGKYTYAFTLSISL